MINAKEYADALFMLSEELSESDTLLLDVNAVSSALDSEREYAALLDSPAIPVSERLSLAEKTFSGVNTNLQNLIMILIEKKSVYYLRAILEEYVKIYEHSRGIERVTAVSARPLDEDQLARIKAKLEAQTGKHIVVTNRTDPSILAGIKLQYMGIQIDGSAKSKLDELEKQLRSTTV